MLYVDLEAVDCIEYSDDATPVRDSRAQRLAERHQIRLFPAFPSWAPSTKRERCAFLLLEAQNRV
jgi:hypothetical protein